MGIIYEYFVIIIRETLTLPPLFLRFPLQDVQVKHSGWSGFPPTFTNTPLGGDRGGGNDLFVYFLCFVFLISRDDSAARGALVHWGPRRTGALRAGLGHRGGHGAEPAAGAAAGAAAVIGCGGKPHMKLRGKAPQLIQYY